MPRIDAVLPAGDSWRLFRLADLRFARVPAAEEWWGGAFLRAEWETLASPGGAFRPVQAVPAARGYFYLVDAASNRFCLYDSTAGLISTFALPERFHPFPAGRVEVFRGRDGAFTFVDYGSGEAWQYADRQGAEGAAEWILRARVKLPVGVRDCVQPPGSATLACRSGGKPLRFDGALNPSGQREEIPGEVAPASRLLWDAAAPGWILEGFSVPQASPLFRFDPGRRRLEPAPRSPLPP